MSIKTDIMGATVVGVYMDDGGMVEGLVLLTPDGHRFEVGNGDEWRGTLDVKAID